MARIPILFLCGEQSPWGFAHLEPLLNESKFEVVAIVVATEERWDIFRNALGGVGNIPKDRIAEFKRLLKRLLPLGSPSNHQRTLRLAEQLGVPVLTCHDVNAAETIVSLKKLNPELVFCAAYPQILKPEFLRAFPKGAFNSHPSLLPRCRGAHPVFWAIASGESQTGTTIHVMTTELDRGGIVAQVPVDIDTQDTRSTLYQKLNATVPLLLENFAGFLTTPAALPTPQDEADATYFRNDRFIHRRIFWETMSASQIHNLVRACDGSAHFWMGRHRVFVRTVEVLKSNRNLTNNVSVPAGTIVDLDNGTPIVMTRAGLIRIVEVRRSMFDQLHFSLGSILR